MIARIEFERLVEAEIVPQPERYGRQLEPAAAAAVDRVIVS